jgi:hypothetical protein
MQSENKKDALELLKDLLNKKNRDKDANERLTSIFKQVDFIKKLKIKDEHLSDITASLTYRFIRKN